MTFDDPIAELCEDMEGIRRCADDDGRSEDLENLIERLRTGDRCETELIDLLSALSPPAGQKSRGDHPAEYPIIRKLSIPRYGCPTGMCRREEPRTPHSPIPGCAIYDQRLTPLRSD